MYNSKPWIEKYRPNELYNIVLNDYNKNIIDGILKSNRFSNLILHGPPGTGKTTTILNLIKEYYKLNNIKNKDLIIHLNASDDRGIDIIRNKISVFTNTKSLFTNGIKIIILDEVDSMTINAQHVLKSLIKKTYKNVRYCLLCNYIHKIDKSLQEEFIHLQFSNIPRDKIFTYLESIINKEDIKIDDDTLYYIIEIYNSDIRSMLNYLQANYLLLKDNPILHKTELYNIYNDIIKSKTKESAYTIILKKSKLFNISEKDLINKLIEYILYNQIDKYNYKFIKKCEYIYHSSISSLHLDFNILLFIESLQNIDLSISPLAINR